MIRAAILALAYLGMIAVFLWALSLHHNVTAELAAVVIGLAIVSGIVILVDETRQQRRKWRDHPSRKRGIIKDWNE